MRLNATSSLKMHGLVSFAVSAAAVLLATRRRPKHGAPVQEEEEDNKPQRQARTSIRRATLSANSHQTEGSGGQSPQWPLFDVLSYALMALAVFFCLAKGSKDAAGLVAASLALSIYSKVSKHCRCSRMACVNAFCCHCVTASCLATCIQPHRITMRMFNSSSCTTEPSCQIQLSDSAVPFGARLLGLFAFLMTPCL